MKRFFYKLTAIVLTRLFIFIEVYVISIFCISPVMCLFWTIKDALPLEMSSGRFTFLVLWQVSCIVFTILQSIIIDYKYRKAHRVEKN